MQETSRVIWKEGLFLQPQHFQQMERFILALQNMRLNTYQPSGFGLTGLGINVDALANRSFSLTACSGIMPDGTPFSLPQMTSLPPARPFGDQFSVGQQDLAVYLALPLAVEGKANVSSVGGDARYRGKTVEYADVVMGVQRKAIEVGEHNFCILFGGEARDNFATLQVARIVRDASGQFALDENYIPPLLHLAASPALMNQLRGLLELLLARNAALSQGRKQLAGGFAEYKGSDVTAYLLLQTLNMFTPLLNYYHIAGETHPFELYKHLSQFVGALCTFSTEVSIRQLPRYEHTELGQVFGHLIRIVRQILEADISAGCVSLPIEQLGPASYLCKVSDAKLFSQARFFLGISASVAEKELLVGTLQRIKICSRDRLELLIPSAMPGLPIIHTQQPPAGLSTKPGFLYFSLDQRGDFWEGMKTSGTIAFYFPNNFPQLQIEILALKE